MFSSFAAHGHVVSAACVLYAVLALASLGVAVGTRARPVSQLRLQVNSWWLIFPVVSVCLAFYPAGPMALVVLIGALALRELVALRGTASRNAWLTATFIATMTGLGFLLALMQLPLAPSHYLRWMFYLFVLTALNDVGQFIAGTTLGRQRIAPAISPNKTWQGLAGGVVLSIAVSLALGAWLDLAKLPKLAFLGAVLALGGFAGDLAYSAVKRRLGIKDFSQLIPGHGGILDRVDSLVVTCPLLYLWIR